MKKKILKKWKNGKKNEPAAEAVIIRN